MIPRTLISVLQHRASQYPVVTLTGPRQSGKTTLVKAAFPEHAYVSLEDPELREHALSDPRGFLGQFSATSVILDEAQRAPDLFSFIQGLVDAKDEPGRFILSGSQNFLLLRSISQSLAGRTAVLHLLPFSWSELLERTPISLETLGRDVPGPERLGAEEGSEELMEVLVRGFYPRLHARGLEPGIWLGDYYRTYVERDVREIVHVGDIETFGRFVRLCAGRNGQLLNLSSLASDAGISHSTAQRWISILESSFLITLLRPHYANFGKRLIKAPKLYFLDTGLLCYLLRIRDSDELLYHSSRGAVFESFVVADLIKNFLHQGREPELTFWRDSAGHEVDLILEDGPVTVPIEIKSGSTISSEFFAGLDFWRRLAGEPAGPAALVYGGDRTFEQHAAKVLSWRTL